MSDDPATFRAKADKMIDGAKRYLDGVGRAFVINIAADLIDTTPGPNLQLPDTEYIAKGQLRDGWSWGVVVQNVATRWNDGGEYDDYGARAFGEIQSAVASALHMPAISYLQNDVAYGHIVHEGLGRMPHPRPWATEVANNAEHHAATARAEAVR